MALKLSLQEKKDLDKFSKFLALKAAQIIVQSRLGEKVCTLSNPQSVGADWFNLAIPDLPDVLAEAKKVISGELLTARLPMCIEISLHTVEGEKMVLESWCLSVLPERCDISNRIIHTVYNHMGILLKSLVSVTRVTPAYKLSRRQGPDTYVICYRIYMDEPQLHMLGDGFKHVRIGQICTPLGTLELSVSYRTKLTISPTQTSKDNSIMVKSDHFNSNLSPKHIRYKQNEEKTVSLKGPLRTGAFADEKLRNYQSQTIVPNIPFGNLLPPKADSQVNSPEEKSPKSVKEEKDHNGNTPTTESVTSDLTMVSTNDDFIMVELKTPFATPNTNTELGQFYKEWQSAPPLKTFTEVPTIAEQVQDLAKQLENYELDMHKFEDVFQSICESRSSN